MPLHVLVDLLQLLEQQVVLNIAIAAATKSPGDCIRRHMWLGLLPSIHIRFCRVLRRLHMLLIHL